MNHLVYLRTFLDTYRAGSVTKAAQRLGITQPAASAHIQALESLVGKMLFQRQPRGVTPTPLADDLARATATHLDELEITINAIRARSRELSGIVHLVGPAEFFAARISPALVPLIQTGLQLRLQTGNKAVIYGALDNGSADLAVTASKPDAARYDSVEIGRERLVLIVSAEQEEMLRGRVVDASILETLPCLAYDENLPLIREYFSAVFGQQAQLRPAVTAPDVRILLALIEVNAGWSVMPDYLCEEALRAGRVKEISAPRPCPENTLYIAWPKGALRHPRVAYTRDHLLRVLRR
jgi:DNA-binding transcriptional LysR family regulator